MTGFASRTDDNKDDGPQAVHIPDVEKKFGDNADIGAQFLAEHDVEYTEEESRRLRWKIDLRIVPLAAWACGLQFVDKSGLGAAATYGLREDLGLIGQEYSWCVSIFYFGYFTGSFVSGRGLQYFHAGKFIGVALFIWGGSLLGCIGATGFASLMVLRFLLGVFESCLVPGLLLITTMWYTQEEQPLRFGLWTMTNGALPVPFLIIYYGIDVSNTHQGLGHIQEGPITSWRLIFLILGLLSSLTGVLMFFFMPDSPLSATWLSDREKAIAIKRVAKDQLGVKNTHFKWEQVHETLKDPHAWLLVLQMFFSQTAGSVTTNFLGIVISGFGYTALKAQLFTAPNYAVQAVMQIIVSGLPTFFSCFRNMKQPLAAISSVVGVIGIALLYVTPAEDEYQHRRLASCIIISFSGVNYTVVMSVIGTNIAGFTRKQIITSTAFFLYCIANIITPQTFLGRESPRYHTGLAFVLACLSCYIVLSTVTWLMMKLENTRRDKMARHNPDYESAALNENLMAGLQDQTDLQNKHLRYSG
ncbi:major facilitator superfamily domain-containing protein [Aspergillus floccosus]